MSDTSQPTEPKTPKVPPPPSTPPPVRPATRLAQQQALDHVLTNVLGLNDQSPLVVALKREGFNEIADIAGLTREDIDDLSTPQLRVPQGQRLALRNVLCWRDDMASKMGTGNTFGLADWNKMNATDFNTFRMMVAPNLARSSGSSTPSATTGAIGQGTATTQSDPASWNHGCKRDPTKWPKFNGAPKHWFKWKGQAKAQALDQPDDKMEGTSQGPSSAGQG